VLKCKKEELIAATYGSWVKDPEKLELLWTTYERLIHYRTRFGEVIENESFKAGKLRNDPAKKAIVNECQRLKQANSEIKTKISVLKDAGFTK